MSHGPLPNAERAVLEGSTCGAAEWPSEPIDSPMLAPGREVTRASFEARVMNVSSDCLFSGTEFASAWAHGHRDAIHAAAAIAAEADAQLAALREAAQGLRVALERLHEYSRHSNAMQYEGPADANPWTAAETALATFDRETA